jgi:hypothetical protein
LDAAKIKLFDPVVAPRAPRTTGLGGLWDSITGAVKHGQDVSIGLLNKIVNPWTVANADHGFKNVLEGTIRTANAVNREAAIQLERHRAPFMGLSDELLNKLRGVYDKHAKSSPEEFFQAVRKIAPELETPAKALRDITLENWAYLKTTGRVAADAEPIMNYLPIVRETAAVDQVISIELNRPMSRILQEPVTATSTGELSGYVPDPLFKLVPTKGQEFFLKSRTANTGADSLSFRDRLDVYAKSYARQIVMDRYVKEVAPGLNAIDPRYQQYAASFINDFLGKPGARAQGERTAISLIKEIEAARTLSGILTPIVNKTQMGNVLLVGVSMKNMIKGIATGNLAEVGGLAKAVGLPIEGLAGPFAGDITATAIGEGFIPAFRRYIRGETNSALANAFSPLSLFTKSETGKFGNIRGAFSAGLYEAKDRGLQGAEALRFAMDVTERSQFTAPVGRTPEIFRGGTWTSLVGQMKSFSLAQLRLLKDNTQGALTGDTKKMANLAKWLVGGAALFGPDFIWPGLEESITKPLLGEATRTPGLLPYIGAALAERAGMGFDANDIRRMMAFLPGPAIAHLADIATGLGYITYGSTAPNFSKLLSFDVPGAMRDGVTPDEAARSLTRALPVFGVPLDRVRKAIKAVQGGGDQRDALDLAEAFGMKPGSGRLIGEKMEPFETVLQGIGLTPDRFMTELQQVRMERDLQEAKRKSVSEVRKLFLAGKPNEAYKIANEYLKRHGEALTSKVVFDRQEKAAQVLTPRERRPLDPAFRRSPEAQAIMKPTRSVLEVLGG